jgi:hypothetical protein
MTHEQFRQWLDDEVLSGRMSVQRQSDLLSQKAWFDVQRTMIEREYRGRVVGCANKTLYVEDTVHNVLFAAHATDPDAMVYFEPIGFDII